jgi:plastocyanin
LAVRVVAVLAALVACMVAPVGGAGPGVASVAEVHIQSFAFNPETVDIVVGDAVTWDNLDPFLHTVSADDGRFNSGNLFNGATFSASFTTAGTFLYHCDIHAAMHGRVRVSEAGALPDLAVVGIALPTALPDSIPGVQQRIDVTVRNIGDGVAGESGVSLDYLYHGQPHDIGTLAILSLGPGESATVTTTWDTLGKVGDFSILATADPDGAVHEDDEGNNIAEAIASVLVTGVEGLDAFEPV